MSAKKFSKLVDLPSVLLLVDNPGWAFDFSAHATVKHLERSFDFQIAYVGQQPKLNPGDYDCVIVYFWGETYHQRFGFEKERVIKCVASHRWAYEAKFGMLTPHEAVKRYLQDAGTIACVSQRLKAIFNPLHPRVMYMPDGVDMELFHTTRRREGEMIVGWAGYGPDSGKGFKDILEPACRDRYAFKAALGNVPRSGMNDFYNSLDIIAIASVHEGQPMPLIEGMAAGCFPVTVDVGIVPEVIRHKENGYIVEGRTIEAFRSAFGWCEDNLDYVRAAAEQNSTHIRDHRSSRCMATYTRQVLDSVINRHR